MRQIRTVVLILVTVLGSTSGVTAGLSYENEFAGLLVGNDGKISLIDRQTGTNLVDPSAGGKLAYITIEGKTQPVTAASADGDSVKLVFGDTGAIANVKITAQKTWFALEIVSASADKATSIDLINVPLTLKGDPAEGMAGCALALNLKTNVNALPSATNRLQATAYAKLGFAGAKVAIILCPQSRLRDVMKEVVASAKELPQTRIGGPWALDNPANQGSYILECTGDVGPAQIDRWIKMLSELGISQLDFHCGRSFRFGDFTPRAEIFPQGVASVRKMTDKLHAAGMLAGFHTYSFFIAKDSPFVTPVPNKGLAFDTTYTLSAELPADAKTLAVAESTAEASAITGFFVRNSATLRVDDELIIYKGCNKQAPFGFTECQRGAYGTKPAAHTAGAKIYHLKELFGLFAPDPESQLFTDVIDRTASVYNDGGFDMIYLDALDGSGVLGGDEWAWYYGSKFVFELANRLKKPALFEMSTFHHHLWFVRSRMGAWDCPARAPKQFIEMHRIVNRTCRDMFLPPHLGWWAIFDWQGIQPERTTPDVLEYLGCKCLADGCGLSFPVGFTPDAYEKSPNIQRLGKIVRQYEELRRSGVVSENVRKRLGTLGEDFTLATQPADGAKPVFCPVRYDKHKVTSTDLGSDRWIVTNGFGKQPLKIRIEALLAAAEYDSPESVVVEDFKNLAAFDQKSPAGGFTLQLTESQNPKLPVRLSCAQEGTDARKPWGMIGRKHSPLLNLANKGLGFYVKADGQAVLNVQVKSPQHAYGGVCDRYVRVGPDGSRLNADGWKYVELIEPEGDDIANYGWPYMPRFEEWPKIGGGLMAYAYPAFHIQVMYDQIESFNLWLGEIKSNKTSCELSAIKALPLKPCKLRNPTVAVNGKGTITFPVELESGQYLEFTSMDDCRVFGPKGDEVATVKPTGNVPEVISGQNEIAVKADAGPGPNARALVTVITQGDPL